MNAVPAADDPTRVAKILGVPLSENVERQWPQMGELVRRRELVARVERSFTNFSFEVGRRIRVGDTVVAEWTCDYGDGRRHRNVTIGELEGGEAFRVTDYWGEPTTTPDWRRNRSVGNALRRNMARRRPSHPPLDRSSHMTLRIKRIYDEPDPAADGFRVLVDRLWPRGVSKERAALDLWLKEIAPSTALRTWFGHRPERFAEFGVRYVTELDDNPAVHQLRQSVASNPTVTLLYGAKDEAVNHAVVLADYLARKR